MPDDVADDAVAERGQTERRLQHEVERDAGDEAGESAPLRPAAMPAAIVADSKMSPVAVSTCISEISDSCSSNAITITRANRTNARAPRRRLPQHDLHELEVIEVGRGVDRDVELQRAGRMAHRAHDAHGDAGGIEAALESTRDHDAADADLAARVDEVESEGTIGSLALCDAVVLRRRHRHADRNVGSVTRRITDRWLVTRTTLPTSPAPVTTGMPSLMPAPTPRLISIVASKFDGRRSIPGARPSIPQQGLGRIRLDRSDVALMLGREPVEEVVRKEQDVLGAIAQRRNRQRRRC